MTTPLLIREIYDTDPAFKRAVRDAVNRLLRDTMSGTTAQRPVAPVMSQSYYDTTILKPITWNGTAWKDGADATV